MTVLHTPRLHLQPFDDCHFEGLQAMNSRPEVMRYITGQPETPEQTRAIIARVRERWADFGYSWWAFIHRDSGRVAGAGCVQHVRREASAPDTPAGRQALRTNPFELGWRLHPDFWRQGLALEAAREMARFGLEQLAAPQLLAVRHPDNIDSRRLMERLGMRYRGLEHWYGTELAVHVLDRAGCLHREIPA